MRAPLALGGANVSPESSRDLFSVGAPSTSSGGASAGPPNASAAASSVVVPRAGISDTPQKSPVVEQAMVKKRRPLDNASSSGGSSPDLSGYYSSDSELDEDEKRKMAAAKKAKEKRKATAPAVQKETDAGALPSKNMLGPYDLDNPPKPTTFNRIDWSSTKLLAGFAVDEGPPRTFVYKAEGTVAVRERYRSIATLFGAMMLHFSKFEVVQWAKKNITKNADKEVVLDFANRWAEAAKLGDIKFRTCPQRYWAEFELPPGWSLVSKKGKKAGIRGALYKGSNQNIVVSHDFIAKAFELHGEDYMHSWCQKYDFHTIDEDVQTAWLFLLGKLEPKYGMVLDLQKTKRYKPPKNMPEILKLWEAKTLGGATAQQSPSAEKIGKSTSENNAKRLKGDDHAHEEVAPPAALKQEQASAITPDVSSSAGNFVATSSRDDPATKTSGILLDSPPVQTATKEQRPFRSSPPPSRQAGSPVLVGKDVVSSAPAASKGPSSPAGSIVSPDSPPVSPSARSLGDDPGGNSSSAEEREVLRKQRHLMRAEAKKQK